MAKDRADFPREIKKIVGKPEQETCISNVTVFGIILKEEIKLKNAIGMGSNPTSLASL